MEKKIKKFFTPFNLFLLGILSFAFFVRIYRIGELLGFYYDQGRDALVIWDLLHKGKLFLIGPTTGIAGIFRGPWYYWLITPFYWLGRGNPVYPSIFLSLTTVAALWLAYKIGQEISGKGVGVLTAVLGGFSFYLVLASRWLSNPTPMFLISAGVIYSVFLITKKKNWAWVALAFLLGMSMQFGSSGEVFYFPAVLLVMLWKKLFPQKKILYISIAVFLITLLPQVAFDIKHGGILRANVYEFLFGAGSFKFSFWETLKVRLPFYFDVFASKIFPQTPALQKLFAVIFGILLVKNRKVFLKNEKFGIVFVFLATPLVGMLFFQGNYGNVYDYYFTGYYLIFLIVFAAVMMSVVKKTWGKILVLVFLGLFLKDNLPQVRNYIISGVDGPTTIALGNERQAVDWIYKQAGNRDFNTDEYVPPVIPYAYDYLFTWYGPETYGKPPLDKNTPLLYTLYEVDPDHPERLKAWLDRQSGIGKVLKEEHFGGITVQERTRLPEKK